MVAWDTVCLPKAAGGINILNMKIWNQAVISKLFGLLANTRKSFGLLGCTHYIKNQNLFTMEIPKQSPWMVSKILNTRKYWQNIETCPQLVRKGKYHIQAEHTKL